MPQSFAAVHLHVIFSTKNRVPLILPDVAPRLHEYLGGVARGSGCQLLIAGGVADHVHLLVGLDREVTLAGLVRDTKAGSSRWVHDTFPQLGGFGW